MTRQLRGLLSPETTSELFCSWEVRFDVAEGCSDLHNIYHLFFPCVCVRRCVRGCVGGCVRA